MNERSIEYGLIISGPQYKDLIAVCDKSDDEFAYFKCESEVVTDVEGHLPVEGDGERDHYISFGDLDHGKPFPQMPHGAKVIRLKLQTLIKPIDVTWGVIEAWR